MRVRMTTPHNDETVPFIDVVFDRPPGDPAPGFVEVENGRGESIAPGTWVQRTDGFWALRIPFDSAEADRVQGDVRTMVEMLMDDPAQMTRHAAGCILALLTGTAKPTEGGTDDAR